MKLVQLGMCIYCIMCRVCYGFLFDDRPGPSSTTPAIHPFSKRIGVMETQIRQTVLSMNDIDMRVQRDFRNMSDEFAMEKATLKTRINDIDMGVQRDLKNLSDEFAMEKTIVRKSINDIDIRVQREFKTLSDEFSIENATVRKYINETNMGVQHDLKNLSDEFAVQKVIQADILRKYVNLERQYSDMQAEYSVLLQNNSFLGTQLSNLQQKFNEMKTAMDISSKIIAFTVKLHGTYGPANSIITAGDILTNIGGGYNGSDGIFNCSVKGLYSFHLHLLSNSEDNGIWIYKNNIKMTVAYSRRGDTDGGSATLLTYLDIGNTITVKSIHDHLALDPSTSFSGMKIQ